MKILNNLLLSSFCLLPLTASAEKTHALATSDPTMARQAVSTWISKGSDALPELRKLAKSGDPRLQKRAKDAIGGITGHWGSEVDLIWKRSMKDAIGKEYNTTAPTGLQQLLIQLPKDKKAEDAVNKRQKIINQSVDATTEDMRRMMVSKVAIMKPQPILVVEPGGKDYFQFEVGKRFCSTGQWKLPSKSNRLDLKSIRKGEVIGPPLHTPEEWKKELFISILKQPLEGGEVTYDSNSLEAIRVIEE